MNDDPFGNAPLPKGSIATASRLKSWWLRTFRGYDLITTHSTPNQNFFGEVYFKSQFILAKRKK